MSTYRPPVPTESAEQIALFEWAERARGTYPELQWMFHIPNGGARSKATAGRLKAEGVKAGVPDIFLPESRFGYRGLWIEMKRQRGGVLSEPQKRWIRYLVQSDYYVARCDGWEDAKGVIESYLNVSTGPRNATLTALLQRIYKLVAKIGWDE